MTKTPPTHQIDMICMLEDVGPDPEHYQDHAIAYIKIGGTRVVVKTPPTIVSRDFDPEESSHLQNQITWGRVDVLIMILEAIGFDREDIDPHIKPPLRREP